MTAVGEAGSVSHSVHPMGISKPTAPNFGDLGKPIVTVDVARLQTELRSLHQRLELLEVAAVVAAEEQEKQEDLDGGSGSSASGEAAASTAVDRGHAAGLDNNNNSDYTADDSTLGTQQGEPPPRYRLIRCWQEKWPYRGKETTITMSSPRLKQNECSEKLTTVCAITLFESLPIMYVVCEQLLECTFRLRVKRTFIALDSTSVVG